MYHGPPVDDPEILDRLSAPHCAFLQEVNGYVALRGGLHVRGACREPAWHSLRAAWEGEHALHRLYPEIRAGDVPFAQDALGDQYLLRDGIVHRLAGETGELASMGMELPEWDQAVRADAFELLSLQPLAQFLDRGGTLEPGELLNVYPPFVFAGTDRPRSFRAVPALQQIAWLADLARQLRDLPDGATVQITPIG